VSGVRVQKKAHRLGSYKAGKLEALKARKLPGFLASQPSSDMVLLKELNWTTI
jgi:hypothetical protein